MPPIGRLLQAFNRSKFGRALPSRSPQTTYPGPDPTDILGHEKYVPTDPRDIKFTQAKMAEAERLDPRLRRTELPPTAEAYLQNVGKFQLGGGIAGGIAGGVLPETEEGDYATKLRNVALGAVGGGLLAPGVGQAVALGKIPADKVSNFLFYSYLSSPDTIARANLGAIGGSITHAFEELALGIADFAKGVNVNQNQHLRNGIETIGGLDDAAKIWWRTIIGSEDEARAIRQGIFSPDDVGRFDIRDQRFRDVGLGRLFSAGDNAGVWLMGKGGLKSEDAMRLTLAGSPDTKMGQWLVENSSRMLQHPNTFIRAAAATLAPFTRVATLGVEEGLKRTPFLGRLDAIAGTRGGMPASEGLRKIRTRVEGPALAAFGYGLGGGSNQLLETLGAVTGPGILPLQVGRELREQIEGDPNFSFRDPASLSNALFGTLGQTTKEYNPLGYSPFAAVQEGAPEELMRRLIPAGLADIAEIGDTAAGRETGRAALQEAGRQGLGPAWQGLPGVGALMGQVPGLRQQLPETSAPVDWRGMPLVQSPSLRLPDALGTEALDPTLAALSTALFPARQHTLAPVANYGAPGPDWLPGGGFGEEDPRIRELAQLGAQFNAPSPDVRFPGLQGQLLGPMQLDAATTGQVQRIRGAGREAGVNILSQLAPYLNQMPQPMRSRFYRALAERVERPINRIENAATRQLALARGRGFRT